MSLIALFEECATEDLPLACASDFFNGSMDGWGATQRGDMAGCSGFGADWTGFSFLSCDVGSPTFQQLNIIKPINSTLTSVQIGVTSSQPVRFDVEARGSGTYPYGSDSHLGDTTFDPFIDGTGVISFSPTSVVAVQVVISSQPQDGSVNVPITINDVTLEIVNSTGLCP